MYIARVTLGNPFLTSTTHTGIRRPPTLSGSFDAGGGRRFDSVIYDGTGRNYREFMVYDRHQCYPEFLIEYERTA